MSSGSPLHTSAAAAAPRRGSVGDNGGLGDSGGVSLTANCNTVTLGNGVALYVEPRATDPLPQQAPPIQRPSRAFRHFKNPPQPHMCIKDRTSDGQELFINVMSWTRIVMPQNPDDPIPLYGGMRVRMILLSPTTIYLIKFPIFRFIRLANVRHRTCMPSWLIRTS